MVVLEIACHSYCDNNITILCVRGRIRAQSHSPRTSGPRSIDLSSRRDGISCLQGCPWRTRVHLSPFTQRRVARSVLRAWWTLSERQYHYQLWSITLEWLRIILTLATSFLLILVNNVLDCNSLMSGLARGITSDIYIYYVCIDPDDFREYLFRNDINRAALVQSFSGEKYFSIR